MHAGRRDERCTHTHNTHTYIHIHIHINIHIHTYTYTYTYRYTDTLDEYDRFVTLHPLVRFSSFIDDTCIDVSCADMHIAAGIAVEAGRDFFGVATALGASINDKFAIISSSSELGREVAQRLQRDSSSVKRVVPYLGVDFAAGAKRKARGTRVKQCSRLKTHRLRMQSSSSFIRH